MYIFFYKSQEMVELFSSYVSLLFCITYLFLHYIIKGHQL